LQQGVVSVTLWKKSLGHNRTCLSSDAERNERSRHAHT
jgi:hypothetical protein